jgi:hypothetical protein
VDVVITPELNMMVCPLPEEKSRSIFRQTDTLLLCRTRYEISSWTVRCMDDPPILIHITEDERIGL